MEPRISIITLGSRDLQRSITFWEAMGWSRKARAFESIALFDAGGVVFGLYPVDKLAKDCRLPDDRGQFGGFTIAHNVRSRDEVDMCLARAVELGAHLQAPAHNAFWGGYSGYFLDLDGYPWEVAFNPFIPLGADGRLILPD